MQESQPATTRVRGHDDEDEVDEPPKKKTSKKEKTKTASTTNEEDCVKTLKDKVRFLCTQNHPSEPLLLLALDELARKAKSVDHEDSDIFEELLREASRNQGKINIVTLSLNVLGGKASDLISKALSKCLKDSEQKSQDSDLKQHNETQMRTGMVSPLANIYGQMPQQMMTGYNPMMMMPQQFMPYNFGMGPTPRPRYYNYNSRQNSARYNSHASNGPRQIGPCLFCDATGHLIKDCAKLKAVKQNK